MYECVGCEIFQIQLIVYLEFFKMALRYTNEEKFEMLVCFIRNNRNAALASNNYAETFPEKQQPNKRYFSKLVTNLRMYGSFEQPRPNNYNQSNSIRDNEVINHFNENPTTSTRTSSTVLDIPRTTIRKVLKKHKYHPYKPTIVQGLVEDDFGRRLAFCNWYITKCQENMDFSNGILWTDETYISNCGIFNRHNHHHWAVDNPRLIAPRRLQTRFGMNVWCGIYGKIVFHFSFFTAIFIILYFQVIDS